MAKAALRNLKVVTKIKSASVTEALGGRRRPANPLWVGARARAEADLANRAVSLVALLREFLRHFSSWFYETHRHAVALSNCEVLFFVVIAETKSWR